MAAKPHKMASMMNAQSDPPSDGWLGVAAFNTTVNSVSSGGMQVLSLQIIHSTSARTSASGTVNVTV